MVNSGVFLPSATLQALTIFSVVVVLTNTAATDAQKQPGGCPYFSCGHLQNIRYPFRLRGDPPWCGVHAYELVCSDGKAVIHINTGRYFVTDIYYSNSSFWVVDANLDNSTCPHPLRNQHPYIYGTTGTDGLIELSPLATKWASFVNCSRVMNNGVYKPVNCLSANNSFVYVLTTSYSFMVKFLEPSCGYLAMIPLGGTYTMVPKNTSYADVAKFMRSGFSVRFPITRSGIMHRCLTYSIDYFDEKINSTSILSWISAILWSDINFLACIHNEIDNYRSKLFWTALPVVFAIQIVKCITVLAIISRFVLAPLAVFTFLAHKFWKTRISIDAVEKFLQIQQALGPKRYAYTDITAITGHFKEKLGQGGYGSVYKGVLPGDVHVAVKMLSNSMCNGDEFISEVSTIGSIHHINVVRLVGFCSKETRRALVYDYMPCGSLDKYVFSSERSFSRDKLNEIALGIARGINYLHQGCDMQILHFDIKPHNILLDSNFTPKIADFGLAKLYPRDNSFVPVSAARGTIGYIAPEMISRSFGVVSCKSDVYSFGMLLLEMAGGRRNLDQHAARRSQAYYPAWVYNRLTQQEVGEIYEAVDIHEVERKLCIIGLWCIQMRSHDRPTMSEVLEMLENGIDCLQIPPEPFFCGDENSSVMDFSSDLSAISENE